MTYTLSLRTGLLVAMLSIVFALGVSAAHASGEFQQGFETDTSGWFDASSAWYGTTTRVASGTNGITSAEGSWHAIFEGDSDSAPFTRFDGYRDTWPGTWEAQIDVYLDPSWSAGQGFDYSVAANGTDGNHQRDYIFHVTKDTSTGELLVGASNNSSDSTADENLENGNHYTVTTAGWYTLQHIFYDDGGSLAVKMNLLDSDGNVLWSETRHDLSDTIPAEVGGNRYGWFTFITVDGGIAVDDSQLNILGTLTASPAEAYNKVGSDHTVTADIGAAVSGVPVTFVVNGVDSDSGTVETDDSGQASFTYTNNGTAGNDTITACLDLNGSGDCSDGEQSVDVVKHWYSASVNGGGQIVEPAAKKKDSLSVSFGGNLYDLGADGIPGDWEVNFHNVGVNTYDKGKFHSTSIVDFNALPADSNTCHAAMNLAAQGTFNGEPGWSIILRAGDSDNAASKTPDDTVRVELFHSLINSVNASNPDYDTHAAGEFTDESSCIGSARTGLDSGNIVIDS